MEQNDSHLHVELNGERIHVRFRDRDVERSILPEIEQQLHDLIEHTDVPKVVIDFDKVKYLPTVGLGVLVSIHKWVREREGQLRLANLDDKIRGALVISRLDRILVICDSTDAAMASFD